MPTYCNYDQRRLHEERRAELYGAIVRGASSLRGASMDLEMGQVFSELGGFNPPPGTPHFPPAPVSISSR
jgi:hypothetical protein